MDVHVDAISGAEAAVGRSSPKYRRLGFRSISLLLAAAFVVTMGVVLGSAGPAAAGDTSYRTIKYLDCWINERVVSTDLGGEVGYAATIYVQAIPDWKHSNPSDCRLKIKVYYDHPPAHTPGNKIIIAPMTKKHTYFNALSYMYKGYSSIKLLKVTMYACKAACSDGKTYLPLT
jgi:hypothetical protein